MNHILFVLDYFTPHLWWTETVFSNIIERLLEQWYKVTVLTTKHDPVLASVEQEGNLTIHRTWSTRINFMRHAARAGRTLIKQYAKQWQPIQLMHTTTYGAALPAYLLAKLFRLKVVLTVHEIFGALRHTYKPWIMWHIHRFHEKMIFRCGFDVFHCVSRYTHNTVRINYRIPDNKLHMIYNGVDENFRNSTAINTVQRTQLRQMYWLEDNFSIMYFGHSGVSKWVDTLLDSIPALVKELPTIKIVLNIIHAQRDKKIRERIAQLRQQWYGENLIEFDGLVRSELRQKVACVDCVVMPSLSDWFGFVAAETCALWIPLVVSEIAALPEVVHGKIHRMQPWSSDSLVKAVKNVSGGIYSEDLSHQSFSRDETVEKMTDMYRTLTSWKKPMPVVKQDQTIPHQQSRSPVISSLQPHTIKSSKD